MKRIALISDIHANLPALRAVLADIDERANVDTIYHLGDLTGYAPWPNEVVNLLRERSIPGISGNYDSTVATDYKHCGCRADTPHDEELSHLSFEWTRSHVTPETKKYLGSLPFRLDVRPFGGHVSGPTITLVHGNQKRISVHGPRMSFASGTPINRGSESWREFSSSTAAASAAQRTATRARATCC